MLDNTGPLPASLHLGNDGGIADIRLEIGFDQLRVGQRCAGARIEDLRSVGDVVDRPRGLRHRRRRDRVEFLKLDQDDNVPRPCQTGATLPDAFFEDPRYLLPAVAERFAVPDDVGVWRIGVVVADGQAFGDLDLHVLQPPTACHFGVKPCGVVDMPGSAPRQKCHEPAGERSSSVHPFVPLNVVSPCSACGDPWRHNVRAYRPFPHLVLTRRAMPAFVAQIRHPGLSFSLVSTASRWHLSRQVGTNAGGAAAHCRIGRE